MTSKAEDLVANMGAMAGALPGEDGAADVLKGLETGGGGPTVVGGAPTVPVVPVGSPGPQPKRDYSRTPARPPVSQSKLSEVFLRHGPEKDPNFVVSLFKIYPKLHAGDGGWVEDYYHPITEGTIRERFPDGGRFEVVIKGSHPRTREPGHVLESVLVDVAAAPKLDRDHSRRGGAYDRMIERARGGGYPPQNGSGVQQPQVTVQPDNSATTMAFQALRDVLSSSSSGKDAMIEQLRDLVNKPQQHGLDPTTVQSLIDANEAQKAAAQARYESMLTEERERATRDMERATNRLERQLEDERAARTRSEEDWRRREEQLRDRFEREVTTLRSQLEDERKEHQRVVDRLEDNQKDTIRRMESNHQQQVDRLTNDAKEEMRRVSSSHSEEMKRLQHNMETRIEQIERSKSEAVTLERERAKMETSQITALAQNQVDNITRQTETSTTHMRELQEAIRVADQTRAETAATQLQHEIERLRDEKRRAEDDARRYREKADENTDPISSVMKYKDMVDTVGSLFGGGETAIVPADGGGDDGVIGRIERIMDTRFGQRAGEIAGAVLGNVLSGGGAGAAPGGPARPQGPMPPTPVAQPLPQPMPQPVQQPTPPPPNAVSRPQTAPKTPGRAAPVPPPPQTASQPSQTPSGPLDGNVDQQIETALYGDGSPPPPAPPTPAPGTPGASAHPGMSTGDNPPPQPPAQQQQSGEDEMEAGIRQINAWVNVAEQMIEQGAPMEAFIPSMLQGLPPAALEGFVQHPIELVVAEVKQFVQTRGIIESEQGIMYLKQAQAVLRQSVPGQQPG